MLAKCRHRVTDIAMSVRSSGMLKAAGCRSTIGHDIRHQCNLARTFHTTTTFKRELYCNSAQSHQHEIDRSKTSGRGQGEETSRIDASENGLVSFHIWAG